MSSHSPRKVALVGSRIRELRKGRHLTQTELSEKIGVAQSDLSRMEQGEYKVGLDTLFKILQVFDLKMGEFFGETEIARGARSARSRRRVPAISPTRRGRRSATSCASRSSRSRSEPALGRRLAPSRKKSLELPGRCGLECRDQGPRPPDMSDRRKHLEFLRKTAKDAIWSGDYERALTLYEDGLALARSWKDRELEDLFTCNRATTLLEMDRQDFDLVAAEGDRPAQPGAAPTACSRRTSRAHAHEVRGEYAQGRASTRRARCRRAATSASTS